MFGRFLGAVTERVFGLCRVKRAFCGSWVRMEGRVQMAERIYNSKAWKTARGATLERDAFTCRVTPGCHRKAVTADHIIPWSEGGAWYDLQNLRATCTQCNSGRVSQRRRDGGWKQAGAHIVLVTGPPLAGKSTYVAANAGPNDFVVDYDAIATALGSDSRATTQGWHEVINAARNTVLEKITAGRIDAPKIWIVSTNVRAESMFPHHEVIRLDPGLPEVRRRAVDSDRTPQALAFQSEWYGTSSESPGGGELKGRW